MSRYTWQDEFLALFDRCLTRYRGGDANFHGYYADADLAFLSSIGYQPREFFDFVEDWGDGAPLPPATALLIAAVRRDFFLTIQHGKPSGVFFPADELPAKSSDELAGIPYFARIVKKARLKLRGELDPEIMFSCGGDRAFLLARDIHPADFLRHVWAAGNDDQHIVEYVTSTTPVAA